MKKNYFSFAILAASFCVMASCGSKSADNAGGADSTELAPEAEETVENLPATKTSFEQKNFIVSVPEGWNTTPNPDASRSDIMLFKGDMENIMSSPVMMINVDAPAEGMTFDEAFKALQADSGAQAIDDVTIGGKTYKGLVLTEGENTGTILAREEGDKVIALTITNSGLDNPEVRTIIQSIKVK